MSMKIGDQEELLKEYQVVHQKKSGWTLCHRVTNVAVSAVALTGSIVAETLASSYRTIRTFAPLSLGMSTYALIDSLCPQKFKFVADQVGVEVRRMGLPLFFLLTQLYLNATSEEARQRCLFTMMALFGMQLASLVNRFATYRFQQIQADELVALNNEKKMFVLIGETSSSAKLIKNVAMGIIGGGIFGLAYLLSEPSDADAVKSLGTFYFGQALMSSLWNRVEIWKGSLELRFEKQNLQTAEPLPLPKSLKTLRGIHRFLYLGVPLSIAALFFKPRPLEMGFVGALHAILDEMKKHAFCNQEISKIISIRERNLTRPVYIAESTARVTRWLASAGGLGYFCYLVFASKDQVYDAAIGSFVSTLVVGFVTTRLADRIFRPQRSSSLITTLFFRTMESPEILALNLPYIYFFAVRYPIRIGNEALNELTLKTGILSFIVWGAYGWSMGQEMAQLETHRYGPQPAAVPQLLLYSNSLLLMDLVTGRVS